MAVKVQTNLVKRGSDFYFRMKVPADLREHYGKESIRQSLKGVTSVAEGRPEARRLADHHAAEFEKVRQERARPATLLDASHLPMLSGVFEAAALGADEEGRAEGMTGEEFERQSAETASELQQLRSAYARGDAGPVQGRLSDWLMALGIDADPQSPEYRMVARKFTELRLRILQARGLRDQGEIVDTPIAPPLAALREAVAAVDPQQPAALPLRRAAGPTLVDVVGYWKGTGTKAARSIMTVDTLVKEFKAMNGDLPIKASQRLIS